MIFAKYIDENCVIRCPQNGYVGKKAISNLNIYFEQNPDVVKAEGYVEFIPINTETDKPLRYRLENGKIFEEVMADDN